MIARAPACALALLLTACGYTTRVTAPDGGDVVVRVPPVKHPGLDPYAPGVVDRALRRAVARAAGLRFADGADAAFHVEVVDVRVGLTPFAEPALRAAQYQAVVVLKGTLQGPTGRRTWGSPAVTGTAPYLSTAGRLEALDGAGRRAVAEAAETAARRLVGALVRHLRAKPPLSEDAAAESS